MTIEPSAQIRRWLAAAFAAMAFWLLGMTVLTAIAEPSRTVVVVAPDPQAVMRAVAGADVAMLDDTGSFLIVSGRSPGFVFQLYHAGAWLVLPARATGCIRPS